MPHILKLVMALMIASLALTACGPSGGDGAGAGTTTGERHRAGAAVKGEGFIPGRAIGAALDRRIIGAGFQAQPGPAGIIGLQLDQRVIRRRGAVQFHHRGL